MGTARGSCDSLYPHALEISNYIRGGFYLLCLDGGERVVIIKLQIVFYKYKCNLTYVSIFPAPDTLSIWHVYTKSTQRCQDSGLCGRCEVNQVRAMQCRKEKPICVSNHSRYTVSRSDVRWVLHANPGHGSLLVANASNTTIPGWRVELMERGSKLIWSNAKRGISGTITSSNEIPSDVLTNPSDCLMSVWASVKSV